MTTAEFQNLKPLPCQQDWFRRHVTEPLKQLDRMEYLCPECDGQDIGERCPTCSGWGTVYISTLEELCPDRAERIRMKALERASAPNRTAGTEGAIP